MKDTWFEPKAKTIKPPSVINAKNNCAWYEHTIIVSFPPYPPKKKTIFDRIKEIFA